MTEVIKRDNRKQKFSLSKLENSITKAAKEAKLSPIKGKELSKDISQGIHTLVKRRKSIRTTEIRKKVLKRLESRSRAIVLSWQRYDRSRH